MARAESKRQGKPPSPVVPAALIEVIRERLASGKPLRRSLPVWGRIHVDRQLPFLVVYRQPRDFEDAGTTRLITSEPSYLMAADNRRVRKSLTLLAETVVRTLSEEFGAFLLVEIWSSREPLPADDDNPLPPRPRFRIIAPENQNSDSTLKVLNARLNRISINRATAEVEMTRPRSVSPPGMSPLIPAATRHETNCHLVGIEVLPMYRDPQTASVFPVVRRTFSRSLSRVLKHTFFEFARAETTHRPAHFHSLGRRSMVKAVWDVDRALQAVSSDFDFLLDVTPVNAAEAWRRFRRRRFEVAPRFHYRPLAEDPALLRRRLWNIPIERLEDPTMGQLFRDKRRELDTRIGMLSAIETQQFLFGSLQLFGKPGERLLTQAREILERVPPRSRDESGGDLCEAQAFAARAREEIAYYRQSYPEMRARVEVRNDIAGLMVSRGNLLVSDSTRLSPHRVEALLQHEVGTHVLTYHNGGAQPFRQLAMGLAGYDELQEGLAVFAEYLVGGLSRPRMRLLAARVIAAQLLIDGAEFVDTFRTLDRDFDFEQRTAFTIVMRIYRGGGLTKDMIYLRGLMALLDYLKTGEELEPLFVGKIGPGAIPIVRELQLRGVLRPPPLRPRYLDYEEVGPRLERARQGLSVLDLLPGKR